MSNLYSVLKITQSPRQLNAQSVRRTDRHSPVLLILLMVLLVALVPTTLRAAGSTRSQGQRVFESGMGQLLDQFKQLGVANAVKLKSGGKLDLEAVKQSLPKIRFLERESLFNPTGTEPSYCVNGLAAQWLTAADNPVENRPVIAYTKFTSPQNFSVHQWRLLFHETISSLGIVDDEYQISSAVFALAELANARQKQATDLMNEPDLASFAAALSAIKTRAHAPRYRMGTNDYCYSFSGGVGVLKDVQLASNTTGIGGGGDEVSMAFKIDLVGSARAWWDHFNVSHLSEADFLRFSNWVTEFGIEPLERDRSHIITNIPIQMEITRSQRTGKLTAYFLVHELQQMKTRQPETFVSYNSAYLPRMSVSHGAWSGAMHMIFEHIYYHILPAKSVAEASRATIYGANMALARGIVKLDNAKWDDQGPYFFREARQPATR